MEIGIARKTVSLTAVWLVALAAAQPWLAEAQSFHANGADVAAAMIPLAGDPLADALDCRVDTAQLPELLTRLRELRPGDFAQAERQYSAPDMDLYRLAEPVSAWGNEGDAIVIADNRVMLAVDVPADEASWRVDHYLQQSGAAPMTGLLDAQHGLVVYPAGLPGLEGMTLVGCEYRIDHLSLLENPADTWRRQPSKATQIGMMTTPLR